MKLAIVDEAEVLSILKFLTKHTINLTKKLVKN